MQNKFRGIRALAAGAAVAVPLAIAPPAVANDIPFAVIGPQEYNLPVNFPQPFNVVVQYGEFNNTNQAWGPSGGLYRTPTYSLFEGLSKYVRFWTIDGVPNIGFAYQVIVPEVMVTGPAGFSVRGIADPLTGPVAYFKPTPNSTIGVEPLVGIPIGESQISNHYWEFLPVVFYDFQADPFSFTGQSGAILRSIQTAPDTPRVNQGTTFFTSLRLGWKATKFWEPFLAFDWQTTSAAKYAYIGGEAAPANAETALGVGVMAHFSPVASLTLRYSRGVEGYNTSLTNAGYLKFAYVW